MNPFSNLVLFRNQILILRRHCESTRRERGWKAVCAVRTVSTREGDIVGELQLYQGTVLEDIEIEVAVRLIRFSVHFYGLDTGIKARTRIQIAMVRLTLTKTVPPVPFAGFPWKLFALIVVVELNKGLTNEISGKKGEERRYWRVAGTGYIPAR